MLTREDVKSLPATGGRFPWSYRQATANAAEDNIKILLDQAFEGKIVFGPIKAELTVDQYGDDNLDITVVYEGDYELLDPEKLNSVSSELVNVLACLGFHNIPTESYIAKAEHSNGLNW